MYRYVQAFSDWVAATAISTTIQNVSWIIPTVQTIHILSIAVVMASVMLLHLRVLGVLARGQRLDAVARRFLPWIWTALIVLLLSGTTLVIGEPGRCLQNPVFIAKMTMLLVVLCLTLSFQLGLLHDPQYWENTRARRTGGRLIAAVSLILWVAIVFAGRWIGYIQIEAVA